MPFLGLQPPFRGVTSFPRSRVHRPAHPVSGDLGVSMELSASELWTRILDSARAGLPEQSFQTWLASASAASLTEGELIVEAPSQFHGEWAEDKYGPILQEAAQRILGRPLRVRLRSSETRPAAVPTVEVQSPGAPVSRPMAPAGSPSPQPALNERYTFERFVVGNDNQLAAAASRAVADKLALMYNPLFLYGGVGLGKTHLMHAIGHQVHNADPHKHVVYITSEQFTNELVSAIQGGTTVGFRRRYRQMDLLLVDDVHFLEGKERTQEEFFHTFNTLYDAQKQVVVTSDRPPKEIPGLEARLVSRFEWGLVADIKVPDYETRVAILRKKADDDQLTLDDEVLSFIAHSCTASVRELEGAIIKLLAYSSLKNQEVTVALAQIALMGMLRGGSTSVRLTPERIREVVARRWSVRPEALSSKRRTRDLTVPRQVAMYLIKDILDTPLVKIGGVFGGRDHSTVIHSIRRVEDEMGGDPEFRREVESVRAELRSATREVIPS